MVAGALNWKKADRTLTRSQVYPLQVITPDGGVVSLSFFQDWGELGIGAIVWDPAFPLDWYINTGEEIYSFNLESQQKERLPIPHLAGVHDLSLIDGRLWAANTRCDEVVSRGLDEDRVQERMSLGLLNHPDGTGSRGKNNSAAIELEDKYHCNQIFKDLDGRLCGLVHHTSGKTLIQKVSNHIIKQQGDGGILYLDGSEPRNLGLHAPHSVRLVSGQYWVLDSGKNALRIYNRQWDLVDSVTTGGWGRGAAVSDDEQLAYIGISATRKRYIGIFKSDWDENTVLEFNVKPPRLKRRWVIPHVDNINNICIIPENIFNILLTLER